jgi:hypothetical protein
MGGPSAAGSYGGSRSWPWLVGMGLTLVVGLGAGLGLGRALSPGQPPSAPGRPATAAVLGVGASRVVAGVPVRYPHTPRGAAEAAANYLAVLGGPLLLDQAKLDAAIDEMAEPRLRAELKRQSRIGLQYAEQAWGVMTDVQQGRRVLSTTTPIAYRLVSYSAEEAKVSVWWMGNVGAASRQRLIALFGISSATLGWDDGDWRLRAYDSGTSSGDVVPALLQSPTPTDGIPAQLDGYVPYGSES